MIRSLSQLSTSTSGTMFVIGYVGSLTTSGLALTDDGDIPGAAKCSGVQYSQTKYASISMTPSKFSPGENYRMQVNWSMASVDHVDHVYFDVVYYPIDVMVTSKMVDDKHPDWSSMRPKEWTSWRKSIHAGHAELCRRIRNLGGRPSFIVKREQLLPLEMALVEAAIARDGIGFDPNERTRWIDYAEDVWNSKGEFSYSSARDDGKIDTQPVVFGGVLVR